MQQKVSLLTQLIFFWIIVLWLGGVAVSADEAKLGQRFALVIGNGNYQNISKLRNAVNDAEVMNKTLSKLRFSVTVLKNLESGQMQNAILDFGDKIVNSQTIEALVFFYSGHGIQNNGQSILLPIDYDPKKPLSDLYLKLEDVLNEVKGTAQNTKIFIIDACREDAVIGDNRLTSKNIANYQIPIGGLLAFSTGPSDVAQDGFGSNSPYTDSLTMAMKQPGLELSAVFRVTREKVIERTNGLQTPTETSKIVGEFYFLPGKRINQIVDFSKEDQAHWRRIKDSQAALDYDDYLVRFPNGIYAEMAKEKYNRLAAFPQSSENDITKSKFGVELVYIMQPDSDAKILTVSDVQHDSILSGQLLKGDVVLQINYNALPEVKDPNTLLDNAFSKTRRLDLLVKRGNALYNVNWHE